MGSTRQSAINVTTCKLLKQLFPSFFFLWRPSFTAIDFIESCNEKQSKLQFNPITARSFENLSNAVRRIRKLRGLSQVELAKKAGVTQATVSRIEQGTVNIETATLFLVFAALNVDMQIVSRVKTDSKNSLEGLF
ncbi:MAG: helix-turn-helix domain-containing protein [Pseudobdellovibrionaceae bacterium]